MSAADNLDKANRLIIDRFVQGMGKACLIPERQAKANCPVDEGLLRASIAHDVSVNRQSIVGRVGTNLEYAPYVHQGTGIFASDGRGRKTPWRWKGDSVRWQGWHKTIGQEPKPFLKNAIEQNRDEILSVLASLQEGIKL